VLLLRSEFAAGSQLLPDPRRWASDAAFLSVRSMVVLRDHFQMWRGAWGGWARDETARAVYADG
jgi:hypothetical protein